MGTQPISQSATSAREAARDKSDGQFGVQDHAESGIVDPRPLSLDPDLVMAKLFIVPEGQDQVSEEDEFCGYNSDSFHGQVERVRNAIWDVQNDLIDAAPSTSEPVRTFGVEFAVDSEGDINLALIGFVLHKDLTHLRVMRPVEADELTDDQDAYGRPAARAIATAMIRQMDEANAEYEMFR